MKRIMFFFALCFAIFSLAQTKTDYKVTKVEVYLSGAKIYTESKVNLSQGENIIIVKNISNSWLPNTIQANVNGNSSLISVTPATNFIQNADYTPKEKELYAQQETLDQKIQQLSIEATTLQEAIELINTNNKIGNNDSGWSPLQVQQLAEYYQKKVLELKNQIFTLNNQIKKINEEKTKISNQILVESRNRNKNQQQVELIIDANSAGMKTIELTYFVNNCGWIPNYDIKAQGKDKPIEIVYRGSVWQTTGVDWNNVQVSLMSNQPNQNQNRPILKPLFANFIQNRFGYDEQVAGMELKKEKSFVNAVQAVQLAEIDKDDEAQEPQPVAFVNTSEVNITYAVKGLHDIISDGTKKILLVDKKEINGRFTYHSVPKLDEKVFLLAYLKNWQQLNLMNAEANIYYQENFIGKIQIDPMFSGEEFPLSLGADNRISIKRIKNKDFSTIKWLNSDKKEEFSFDIITRNNTNSDIEIEILDQIPVSNNKDIEIELIDKGNAEYLEGSGFLSWKFNIASGNTKKINFKYQIKSPKDQVVSFQN